MSDPSLPRAAAELEDLGVLVVVDEALQVTHVSERCEALLGEPPEDLLGQPLGRAAGADADRMVRHALAEGLERAGGWWPATLPGGGQAKLRAFAAAPGLVGVDVMPVLADGVDAADADSIERVAGWNDWLQSCTSSASLLSAAASVTRQRLGFNGVWVCRIESGGHNVVAAADVEGGERELVGDSVLASDLPPSQPQVRGRAVPFFVSDLRASGVRLSTTSTNHDLDLDASALLRPYPVFLDRLASLGVRSTASLPIIVDGQLWGRIIAHDPAPAAVPAVTQSELRLLAATTSARLAELIEQEDAREQVELGRFSLRAIASVAASDDLVDGLTQEAGALTGVCAADGAIVAVDGRVATVGLDAGPAEIDALLRTARAAVSASADASLASSVVIDAGAGIDPGTAAGYLAVRLGQDADDLIVWVRGESTRTQTWVEHQVVGDAIADELFTGVAQRQERSNGTCVPWTAAQLAQAAALRDAIGQVLIARYRQVRALNAELTRSNEEYDAFAHAAAHDLKAPLRGIRQTVDFHLEDTEGRLSKDEQAQLHTVTRLVDRMSGLLDDLMAYAQVGNAAWEPRPLDVSAAVADAVELLGPAVSRCAVTAQPGSFPTDPAALRQILLNLIGNAAKYSDGPSAVTVASTTLGEAAAGSTVPDTMADAPPSTPVLTVADGGIGIDPAHHERIFNLFHQLDPRADGTGTGLALCRLICRRHGGDIWVASAPGAGTTFYVATSG